MKLEAMIQQELRDARRGYMEAQTEALSAESDADERADCFAAGAMHMAVHDALTRILAASSSASQDYAGRDPNLTEAELAAERFSQRLSLTGIVVSFDALQAAVAKAVSCYSSKYSGSNTEYFTNSIAASLGIPQARPETSGHDEPVRIRVTTMKVLDRAAITDACIAARDQCLKGLSVDEIRRFARHVGDHLGMPTGRATVGADRRPDQISPASVPLKAVSFADLSDAITQAFGVNGVDLHPAVIRGIASCAAEKLDIPQPRIVPVSASAS